MKRQQFMRFLFSMTLVFAGLSLSAQKDTITPIKDIDVDKHLDKYITIEGLVVQYTPSTPNTTAYYIIKGEYGRPIQVNTSTKKPAINRKYRVQGIVKSDPMTDQPYLVEIKKRMIIPIWIFIGFGSIVLLILVVVVLMLVGNQKKSTPRTPPVNNRTTENAGGASEEDDYEYDEGFKTVKIVTKAYDLTLKKIPGKLKILGSDDDGKEFKLQGKFNGVSGIITIGRDDAEGSDKATHIRITDRTVSKQQAEIIYTEGREKKVLLKNLSKVNHSQVNGDEIMVDETRKIVFGDKLRFGSASFEYVDD